MELVIGRTDRRTNGRMDDHTYGWTDGRTDKLKAGTSRSVWRYTTATNDGKRSGGESVGPVSQRLPGGPAARPVGRSVGRSTGQPVIERGRAVEWGRRSSRPASGRTRSAGGEASAGPKEMSLYGGGRCNYGGENENRINNTSGMDG